MRARWSCWSEDRHASLNRSSLALLTGFDLISVRKASPILQTNLVIESTYQKLLQCIMDVEQSLDQRISDRKGARPAAARAPRPNRAPAATPYAVCVTLSLASIPILNDRLDLHSDLLRDRPRMLGPTTCMASEGELDLPQGPVGSGHELQREGKRGS